MISLFAGDLWNPFKDPSGSPNSTLRTTGAEFLLKDRGGKALKH